MSSLEVIPAVQLYPADSHEQTPSPSDGHAHTKAQDAVVDKVADAASAVTSSIDSALPVKARINKLQKRLRRDVGRAIEDFSMIEAGDKVMVCLSGGKDSYAMLDILLNLQKSAPIPFELVAVNLDQKQPGFPEQVLPEYLRANDVPFHIIERDTYSVVKEVIPEGKTTCGLCSRMRRGTLYRFAEQQGFTKIALGHHRDDILETFFLNMFYGGKLKTMPPKLRSDDGKNIVIRPMAYCREKDLIAYADLREFPIIPCNLCGSQENLQRQVMKEMLQSWDQQFPGRIEVMFSSLRNVVPSHLVDNQLFDFNQFQLNAEAPVEAIEPLDILAL